MIVVHVTHEAVEKIGGIGAVIAGLTTTKAYTQKVSRTILLGPLLTTDRPVNLRLGDGGHVTYSSLDAVESPSWKEKFHPIEKTYDVGILYGTRRIHEPCDGREVQAEVLLMDVFHSNQQRLNLFKAELYKKFAIPSNRFENVWEFEEYIRLAEPGFEALKAIGIDGKDEPVVFLAHEYMGIPTALKVVLSGTPNMRTIFYAHEVASVRPVVEKMPGHDTMFYNILKAARQDDHSFDELFPLAKDNFKHCLVKAGRYCDGVFAVGDYVVEELTFLDRHFRTMEIDLVYNGIPATQVTLDQKRTSRTRMQQYAENLFGRRPNWILAHVARPVLSKGIWRDLRVLHEMEPILADRGESAVFFMLGTLAGQRRSQDILQMEKVYGWPVRHEMGYPDLCGGEEIVGEIFEQFNRGHKAVQVVFVNQWDWNHKVCGQRMPAEMTFLDMRCGMDLEFGLSVYEPFGISQLEPLSFGALCVVSNVCGCMGFVKRTGDGTSIEDHIIEADFISPLAGCSLDELKNLPTCRRDEIESAEAHRLAYAIVDRLPRDEQTLQHRIENGFTLARKMSWQHIVQNYFLPSLQTITARQEA